MIIAIIILLIVALASGFLYSITESDSLFGICAISVVVSIILGITGCFTGFINHPATEGMQQGIITAVDLEGIFFRRYEVYIKSGGYTTNSKGQMSDETKYLLYDYEKDLAEELKSAIGKEIKLYYGHDGGYIGWNNCGTYHIKKVELIEEDNVNE